MSADGTARTVGPDTEMADVLRDCRDLITGMSESRPVGASGLLDRIDAVLARPATATGGREPATPNSHTLQLGETVSVRWLDRDGYHHAVGVLEPADGQAQPLRVTLRRHFERNDRPTQEFAGPAGDTTGQDGAP